MQSLIRPIISFIASFTITALIISMVGLLYLFLSFDLVGGETLGQIENRNISLFIITLVLLAIAIVYVRGSLRKGKKYTAYGAIMIPALIFIASSIFLILQNFSYQDFDKSVWYNSTSKPENMAKTLVKEKMLIGLTRSRAKEMLGTANNEHGDDNSGSGFLEYSVENDWTLTVIFEQDKVTETILRQPFLGI